MKLSEAIARGAAALRTVGPGQPLAEVHVTQTDTAMNDCLTAAQLGLLNRLPTRAEYLAFYWENPWGATHNTPLGNWLRATEAERYRWADVISKLKAYGA